MSRRTKLFWLAVGVAAVFFGAMGLTLAVMTVTTPSPPPPAMAPARFVDETRGSGIAHVYAGDLADAVGGGIAVFDCDDDGKPDLYIAGGSNPAALFRNDSPDEGALLFDQIRDPTTDLVQVTGAYPIDIDGDGITDVVVLRNGENVILRGLGDCRFERANERWGFDGGSEPTNAFSATWEGAAILPTLAFGNYLRPEFNDPHRLCFDNEFVRPDPVGGAYLAPVPLTPSWCALSMLFSDWDRSGRRDLRVSNDRYYYLPDEGEEQLWRIAPGEAPRLYTDADGWARVQIQGMGIATYDLTDDGYPEYFLTSQADNRLQSVANGPSQPTYHEIGRTAGVSARQPFTGGDLRASTAWHPEFEDVNNDGLIDLFISKGNVKDQPDYAQKDPSNLLLGQSDGTFDEAADTAGILNFERARGAALADFNLDGLLDLVEVNYGAPVRIWRNAGSGDATQPKPMGNWVAVRLEQPGQPNRDAIGSWIELRVGGRTVQREVTIGGGHASGQLGWIHFGLGASHRAQIRVQWPDGELGPWLDLAPNRFAIIERGADRVQPWSPSPQ